MVRCDFVEAQDCSFC